MSIAKERFQEMLSLLDKEDCAIIQDSTNTVIDAGSRENLGGWEAGRKVLEALLNGEGRLEYGNRLIGSIQFPTIDIYTDHPVKTAQNMKQNNGLSGITASSSFEFGYTNDLSIAQKANGNIVKAEKGSMVDSIFEAGTILVPVVEAILNAGISQDDILWAFSTCPLPTLAGDEGAAASMFEEALKNSAVSVWIKSANDTVRSLPSFGRGDIRIHDFTKAETLLK